MRDVYEYANKRFQLEKFNALTKPDKSKKSSIDRDIKPLIKLLNSFEWCYTTSSCSGRIVLLEEPLNRKKHLAKWWFVSHEQVLFDNLKISLNQALNSKERDSKLWLKMEGFIIHLIVNNIEKADIVLKIARDTGLKHSGVLSFKPRIVLEIRDNEIMQCLINKKTSDVVVKDLLQIANEKLGITKQRLKRFLGLIERLLDQERR